MQAYDPPQPNLQGTRHGPQAHTRLYNTLH